MRKPVYLSILIAIVSISLGCAENQTRIGEGAGIGGVLGAAAGGIIGHQTHSTAAGMLIGGAVGAAGGAAVGAQIPKQQQTTTTTTYAGPSTASAINQVTMQQIVDWTRQGLPSDVIISRIKTTNSMYALTADDVAYLRKQGVSERVVETMQSAR
jgi:uncharacterized protein YcfJ